MSASTLNDYELLSKCYSKQKVFETDDLMLHIIQFLSLNEIATLSRTSKRFQMLCRKQLKARRNLIVTDDPLFTEIRGNTLYPFSEKDNKRITIVVSFQQFLNIARDYMPNIRRLSLELCNDVNDENFVLIGKYLQNLNELWLFRGSKNLKEIGFSKAFDELKNLKKVHILHANIDSCFLRSIPQVEELSLFDNYDTSDCNGYNYDDEYYIFERLQHSLQKLMFHRENPNPQRLLGNLDSLKELILYVNDRNAFNTLLDIICERKTLKSLKVVIRTYDGARRSYLPICTSVTDLAIDIPYVYEKYLIQIIDCFPKIEVLSISMANLLDRKRTKLFRSVNKDRKLKELNLLDTNIEVMRDARLLESAFLGIIEIDGLQKLRIGCFDKSFMNPFIYSLQYFFETNPECNTHVELVTGYICMRVAKPRSIKVQNKNKIKVVRSCKRKYMKFVRFFPMYYYRM